MKNTFFTFFLLVGCLFAQAQTSFDQKINSAVERMDKAKSSIDYDHLFEEFSALTGEQSENQWKAYYYAGLSLYNKGELLRKNGEIADLGNTNAVAYKYVATASYAKPDLKMIKDLLQKINLQKIDATKK